MSSGWWSGKETTDGRRNNVVEGVTVPSVEKPHTWNSCVTNPGEQETSQRELTGQRVYISNLTGFIVSNVLITPVILRTAATCSAGLSTCTKVKGSKTKVNMNIFIKLVTKPALCWIVSV